jgi:lipoyl-dependent peroxiredoxin
MMSSLVYSDARADPTLVPAHRFVLKPGWKGKPEATRGGAMATVTGTERTAEVTWHGDLIDGSGTIESVGSGAFGPLPVSWKARTEQPDGQTSPDELVAAAHAACFSMALSHELAQSGSPPETLSSVAQVTFVPGTGITAIALQVEGVVPGLDDVAFREAAERAKDGCPVSLAVKGNVDVTVRARLK